MRKPQYKERTYLPGDGETDVTQCCDIDDDRDKVWHCGTKYTTLPHTDEIHPVIKAKTAIYKHTLTAGIY